MIPDSLLAVGQPPVQLSMHKTPHHHSWIVLEILVFMFAGIPIIIWLGKKYRRYRLHQAALEGLDSHFAQYDQALSEYNSYYRSLSPTLRRRFQLRVAEFMETKKFEYVDTTPEAAMPLLISAAAVQLTFGLDRFLLEFFDTIFVLRHDYTYGMYTVPFVGHVNRNGIYLSWDNFLRGFANDEDGDNVGVHEMAHALSYVNFNAQNNDGEDNAFKARFRAFTKTVHPIYEDMQQGGDNMLDHYAATNFDEFWAVSVETFFEKAQRMKEEMPVLYNALCELLQQDPLQQDKLLRKLEAA